MQPIAPPKYLAPTRPNNYKTQTAVALKCTSCSSLTEQPRNAAHHAAQVSRANAPEQLQNADGHSIQAFKLLEHDEQPRDADRRAAQVFKPRQRDQTVVQH